MARPLTIILTGYGINCEEESAFAFSYAGADTRIIHVNDIIENKHLLEESRILVFPGGFAYGDDTGSGKALANKIKNNLFEEISYFIERDTLILGICNGFQVLVNLGIIPTVNRFTGTAEVALEYNSTFRYQCRWVDLFVEENTPSVFTKGIKRLHLPVAHGEGNFFAPPDILNKLEEMKLVTMRYIKPDGLACTGEFPFNPNGSLNDIASICSKNGRIMGMMPHPERGMMFTQRDDWTYIKEINKRKNEDLPDLSDGMAIFINAVNYFK